jgi:hypothetical protein
MERNDDPRLREVLREWDVAGAPRSLDARVLGRARSPWQFLLTGAIRVPVPICFALMAVLLVLAFVAGRQHRTPVAQPARPAFNLRDFQPVQDAQIRVIRRQHATQ